MFNLRKNGFTLVEVLIALVILIIVIIGVYSVESGNIKFTTTNKYKIQANGIGQEGVNIVKSLNDQVKLGGTNASTADCKDPSNSDPAVCPAGLYFLNSSQQLMKCKTVSGTDATTVNTNNATTDCAPPVIPINGKDYTRIIEID